MAEPVSEKKGGDRFGVLSPRRATARFKMVPSLLLGGYNKQFFHRWVGCGGWSEKNQRRNARTYIASA